MKQLLSPKQVAASIGVSESSLKRWCDQGAIPIERTPGGHRRIRLRDAVQFARRQGEIVLRPELLGLPEGLGGSSAPDAEQAQSVAEALGQGDTESARKIVFSEYLGGRSLGEICDLVLTPAMQQLGQNWVCGALDIYQERRACEIVSQLLFELRSMAPPAPANAPLAIGGTPEGDHYRLATSMVEIALVEAGWQALSLGTSLPFGTIAAAANRHRPRLLWLSVSFCADAEATGAAVRELVVSLPEETRLVIGGQAAPHGICVGGRPAILRCGNLRDLQAVAEQARLPTGRVIGPTA